MRKPAFLEKLEQEKARKASNDSVSRPPVSSIDILLGQAGHHPPSRKGSGSSQPAHFNSNFNPEDVKLPDSEHDSCGVGFLEVAIHEDWELMWDHLGDISLVI